jgi:hypothetical protein
MIAIPALVVCAAAIDDAIRVQVKMFDTGWTESARLWAAMIAESGGKKTPALSKALDPLQEKEWRWQEEDAVAFAKYESQEADRKAAQRARAERIKEMGHKLAQSSTGMEVPDVAPKPPRRRTIVMDFSMESLTFVLKGQSPRSPGVQR